MVNSFDRLIEQIDAFIRKYYKNQMIKGALFFVGVLLVSFLLTTTLEYFGRFGSLTRGTLFFSFIGVNLFILGKYLIIPLMKLYSFGKRINRYQASDIIGSFFPSVSDRLKNTLQLHDALETNEGNIELLRASVAQRSTALSVVPFVTAIDFKSNRRYVKYLLPVFLVFIVIGVAAPGLFTDGTERVVNYSKEFKEEAPFEFVLGDGNYLVEEGDDLPVEVVLKGKELPEQVYLISENGKFLMKKTGRNSFSGIIKKPKKTGVFSFEANEFESAQYGLKVFGKATVGKFEARLVYPNYLGKSDEVIANSGDLTVPEGTEIEWSLVAKNTRFIELIFNNNKKRYASEGLKFSRKLVQSSQLSVILGNQYSSKIDSVSYQISVVKDAYPTIQVEEKNDTVSAGVRYFKGQVSDDYGLNGLNFVYTIISENGQKREERMSVQRVLGTNQTFDFGVDFRRENVKLNDRIEYYFVVSDNDGVNGSKSTRSQVYTYKLPSLEELNEKREEDQIKVNEELSDLLKRTKDFQKDVDKLKKDVLNSKKSDWNKTNQINQLKEEQKSILESLESMQQVMEQSTQEKNQLSEMDKELMEKQDMIEKLLEELMDDELRDLLNQLEKLLEKNDKEGLKEKLDDIEQSSEDMNKQLDRSLEMLKRLQVNEKIDDVEKELKELAKEQKELKDQLEKSLLNKEDGLKKQEEINKKFDDLKKDLDELKELNQSLDKPMEIGDTKEDQEKIQQDLNESKSNMESGKSKKAGESQKSAADEMEQLAEKLDSQQQESNKQQEEEDINSLRNILESLMALSFDQEDVMMRFSRINDSDPAYRRYGRRQRTIVDDTKIVRDSLLALAKRQPKIAAFVDKELAVLKENHLLALEDIDEHRQRELGLRQQTVMTAYNNLALLLNESLQSMQSQMKSKSEGSGSCNNPGGKGKPKPGSSMNPGDMKQMLKKQLQQMEKGPNPGGEKPGDQPGQKPGQQGQGGMGMPGLGNKEIAKMAAEQTAIRQRLEQLRNELNKDGKGKGNQLNPLIKELEEQEKDLINKNFSKDLVKRQKDILTRLLESEKALMERGFEEKRESTSGKNENYGNKIRFDEYNKQKLNQIELLRTVDPVYRKYYKDKANEYFNQSL
jgi:hypothetical protein